MASGNACEKDWLQSSTAASRDDLVVVFHWMPPWHWSMTNAIAKKDFTSFGHRPCGWMIVSKKCLITGKMAKHSDAVQLNFWAFLFFSIFFFWKSVWIYWHLWLFGYCQSWYLIPFQKLVGFKTCLCNGLQAVVDHHWSSALQNAMHPIMAKLGDWLHKVFGQ